MSTEHVVTAMVSLVILVTSLKAWAAAYLRMRIVYWLMLLSAALQATNTIVIYLDTPHLYGLLFYLPLNAWVALMGVVGLMRLREK